MSRGWVGRDEGWNAVDYVEPGCVADDGHYRFGFTQDDLFTESISGADWDQCSSAVMPIGRFEPTATPHPDAEVFFLADASKYGLD